MSQSLIEKLRSYIEFNEDEERFIDSVFRVKHFAKGEHFLLAGDVCCEAINATGTTIRSHCKRGFALALVADNIAVSDGIASLRSASGSQLARASELFQWEYAPLYF